MCLTSVLYCWQMWLVCLVFLACHCDYWLVMSTGTSWSCKLRVHLMSLGLSEVSLSNLNLKKINKSIARLKCNGDKTLPCLTPVWTSKESVIRFPSYTVHWNPSSMILIALIILLRKSYQHKIFQRLSLSMLSKTFSKSMNNAYWAELYFWFA